MDSKQLVHAFHDAYNRRAIDALGDFIAPEQRYLDVPFGMTFTGPAGVKDFFQNWLTAFPDSVAEINELHGQDHVVTDLFTFRGTHTGTLKTPGGDVPATGKKLELTACFVFETRGGKIVASRNYYDVASIMRQLGLG